MKRLANRNWEDVHVRLVLPSQLAGKFKTCVDVPFHQKAVWLGKRERKSSRMRSKKSNRIGQLYRGLFYTIIFLDTVRYCKNVSIEIRLEEAWLKMAICFPSFLLLRLILILPNIDRTDNISIVRDIPIVQNIMMLISIGRYLPTNIPLIHNPYRAGQRRFLDLNPYYINRY